MKIFGGQTEGGKAGGTSVAKHLNPCPWEINCLCSQIDGGLSPGYIYIYGKIRNVKPDTHMYVVVAAGGA